MKSYLITGGAGFIGGNFSRMMVLKYPDVNFVILDKLTYAGRRENLSDLEDKSNFVFVKGDIADKKLVEGIFEKHDIDVAINFAAETHVDRSIENPGSFIMTDVYGTYVLLEAARKYKIAKFIQISTDEVYGSIQEGSFNENSPLHPSNPYSASKSGADRLAFSYYATYGLPVIITRCSNNYGPFQYPEKFIPLFVTNALEAVEMPLYGDGKNIRDWIFVEDHCEAVEMLITKGVNGEVYNIGGGQELENIQVANMICDILGIDKTRIKCVTDRIGHDRRYSLSFEKIMSLGWRPKVNFDEGLAKTISWYSDNTKWWKSIKSAEF